MDRSNNFEKYETLIDQLDQMIADKGRGFNVARELNDALWEDAEARRTEMSDQLQRLRTTENEDILNQELSSADSIYEATRNYLSKFGK